MEGYNLEITKETKDRIFYKKIQKPVFIHAEEIFMPAVAIDEETLSLSRMEHIPIRLCVILFSDVAEAAVAYMIV